MSIGFIIVGSTGFLVLGFLWYASFFAPIRVEETTLSPIHVAYKTHTGPYQQTGKIMDEVYESLKAAGTETTQGFGIYYDSPKQVAAEKLRSIAGCVLPSTNTIPSGIKTVSLPETKVIHAQIPYRHPFAVMSGLMKAYPKLEKYRQQHQLSDAPTLEIYDIPNKTLHYYVLIGLDKHTVESYLE